MKEVGARVLLSTQTPSCWIDHRKHYLMVKHVRCSPPPLVVEVDLFQLINLVQNESTRGSTAMSHVTTPLTSAVFKDVFLLGFCNVDLTREPRVEKILNFLYTRKSRKTNMKEKLLGYYFHFS